MELEKRYVWKWGIMQCTQKEGNVYFFSYKYVTMNKSLGCSKFKYLEILALNELTILSVNSDFICRSGKPYIVS